MDRLGRAGAGQRLARRVLSAACDFSSIWDLRHPSKEEIRHLGLDAVALFWWRCDDICDQAYVELKPNARYRSVDVHDWDTPVADRLACMAAICGTLHARGLHRETVCDVLKIGSEIHSKSLNRWRAESMDYRFMVCALRGDLAHKALRAFVLGLPGAC